MKDRSAYRRLMDAVVVTPELEERVLEAVARRACLLYTSDAADE